MAGSSVTEALPASLLEATVKKCEAVIYLCWCHLEEVRNYLHSITILAQLSKTVALIGKRALGIKCVFNFFWNFYSEHFSLK
jgi:hypothetical protein